jgi:hypothetical protein
LLCYEALFILYMHLFNQYCIKHLQIDNKKTIDNCVLYCVRYVQALMKMPLSRVNILSKENGYE